MKSESSRHESKDGTQVLRRAAGILRSVAQGSAQGTSLAEIARHHGLARSTAHRILQCLTEEGLLEQETDKRYRVGSLLHELGMVPGASAAEIAQWSPVVAAVAQRTGATAYLIRRSGAESVCLVKVDGPDAMRFLPVEVGQRRFLGLGAGGTALLAALSPGEAGELIHAIALELRDHPRVTPQSLTDSVNLVHQTGFAISQGVVTEHAFGVGLVVPDDKQAPHLALTLAAHASMVTESTVSSWKQILREEAQRVRL